MIRNADRTAWDVCLQAAASEALLMHRVWILYDSLELSLSRTEKRQEQTSDVESAFRDLSTRPIGNGRASVIEIEQ